MSTPIHGFRYVETLTLPEMMAVSAARSYRALRERMPGQCCGLRQIFVSTHLVRALPVFIQFQTALSADPDQNLTPEAYGTSFLGEGEARLLCALAHWQYRPHEDPQESLAFIRAATVRRIAACTGRAFALQMASAGLWLPEPRITLCLPDTDRPAAAEDFDHAFTRLH